MFNIAIDGPAGAGKSSIAKNVAGRLGFIYVDTGALYRTVALAAVQNKSDVNNAEEIIALLPNIKVELAFEDGVQKVLLNGKDVSSDIRLPEVSSCASKVSAIPEVRSYLFRLQQEMAQKNNCIMDGRDIGTVVLPNADLKIFLTASPEVRAKRRYLELQEKGETQAFEDVLKEMIERDERDMNRPVAPLKQAEDAVLVDSSDMSFEEVTDTLLELCKKNLHADM